MKGERGKLSEITAITLEQPRQGVMMKAHAAFDGCINPQGWMDGMTSCYIILRTTPIKKIKLIICRAALFMILFQLLTVIFSQTLLLTFHINSDIIRFVLFV